MIVCKFGGSCTANEIALQNIQTIKTENPDRAIFVFSAIGKDSPNDTKMTDLLISLCNTPSQSPTYTEIRKQVLNKFKKLQADTKVELDIESAFCEAEQIFMLTKDKEFLISRGEYFTAQIMASFLSLDFFPAEDLIFFKGQSVDESKTQLSLNKALKKSKTFVTCGFYGKDENNKIRLFTRGGGDFSGAIISKLLNASTYENWTDVEGIYDINPNIAKGNLIKRLSISQLDTMTNMDTKVIHKDCAKLLSNSSTTLVIRSCFNLSQSGTTVEHSPNPDLRFVCFRLCDSFAEVFVQDRKKSSVIKTDKQSLKKTVKAEYQKLFSKTKN